MAAPVLPNDCGIYVHLPWCIKKCPYCDFNSHSLRGELPEQDYINALLLDLDIDITRFGKRAVNSIFIGGGTPSLFSADSIASLIDGIKQRLSLADNIEITMEANPGTFEQSRFSGFRQAGINRLSIGIQSLHTPHLQKLGRIHSAKEALNAFAIARKADFDNINIDLMFGLPDQSNAQALHDIQQAITLHPEHISWYQLTLEPNTLFHAKPPQLPSDDTIWQMQQQGQQQLRQHGYAHYEVSAYAQANKQCQHNRNYWLFGDYYGIGAGAHSKLTTATDIVRNWKIKQPNAYLHAAQTTQSFDGGLTAIKKSDLAFEFMLNALRLHQSISYGFFEKSTGLSITTIKNQLQQAKEQQLLVLAKDSFYKTELGERFLNDLIAIFLTM